MELLFTILTIGLLLIASKEDFEEKLVSSKILVLISLSSLFYMISRDLPTSEILRNMEFAFKSVGIVVVLELFLTTIIQEYIATKYKEFENVVSIGSADFILVFAITSIFGNFNDFVSVLLFTSIFISIHSKITKSSTIAVFPSATLGILLVLLLSKEGVYPIEILQNLIY